MLIKKLSLINGGFLVRVLKCNGGGTCSVGSSCGSWWWPKSTVGDKVKWTPGPEIKSTVLLMQGFEAICCYESETVWRWEIWVLAKHMGKKPIWSVLCLFIFIYFSLNATVSSFSSFIFYLSCLIKSF